MRALIAGAGIGGLTTALSLHAAGIEATIVEAGPQVGRLGVGINLLPHAVRELTELGLGDALAASAIPTGEMVHFDRYGGRIWAEPRGRALGYDWPQYSVHRGDLQAMLYGAVTSRLGDVVRTGSPLTAFDQSTDAVRAQVAGETIEADVLVGADGLYSRVRARLHPDEPPPLWNGIRMWRGVAEGDPVLSGRTLAVAGSNSRAKFVVYPISRPHEERGRALLNWVAEVRLPDGSAGPAEWDRTGSLDEVLPHYADWRFDWLDVPALIRSTERILQYPMVDRDPLPFWSQGRVTLVGDAAHPMYPIGSNGGSQAILDARVLAYELARSPTTVEALAAYDKARREPVNSIVLANREMPADRVLHTVAERAPDGFARIEDVLTPAELATITGAYKQTSFADVETLNTRPSWTP